ncbi:T9SS type A sorting domain-containing protein [Flavobacterium lindanitolerans]|uniref:Secreted protein (Por secretion system target) n=1 Tax=Flavobacterium lindanitolerans TaxID=428988 RepID=A0A497U7E9_9FLAO|nr:T9SS type A sorting domain-containing protein [Flavobacterium lindanitolerans]PKW29938.1 putative secreted protein (Por secretion system target) [Flavobacterium lindanitolerans]RLJ24278.1 putative secreted protein (Por secretion system target) [Flavobacterium lindanitolerans]
MKKILLFFTILISNYLFCQVTIDGITVNNVGISGTTINLGTSSSVSVYLNAAVNLNTVPSDSSPGTITIYYKKAPSLPAIVANGGDGGSLLFLGSTFAIKSFRLTLDSAQFDTTGGILYAEYKTFSGIITKSANISIKKDTTSEPGGQPGGGGNACHTCGFERIPFGGIPILPWNSPSVNTDYLKWFIKRPSGETVPYSTDRGKEIYEPVQMHLKENQSTTSPTYVFNIYTERPYSRYDNYIKRLNISNSIEQNQTIEYGGTPETIIGTAGNVNGQPNNTYQWQERVVAEHQAYGGYASYNVWYNIYGWKNIPNANQINYTPPINATEVKAYRRLIFDTYNIPMSSNEVTIYVVSTGGINNTICCDKTYFSNNSIDPIVGSPMHNAEFYIQWQKGIIVNNQIIWYNIDGANSQDYTPTRPGGRNSSGTFYYRRALISLINNKFYVSNTTTIIFSNASGRNSSEILKNKEISDINIMLYPNPSSSVVNIESEHDLSSFNAKIIDVTGRLILKNNYELSGYSTQLNISDLPTGIYTIIIENGQDKIIKKLIKK